MKDSDHMLEISLAWREGAAAYLRNRYISLQNACSLRVHQRDFIHEDGYADSVSWIEAEFVPREWR